MRAPRGAACESPSATATSWFKCPTVSERPNGSESKSDWYSSRHHARLDSEGDGGFNTFASNIHTDFLVRKYLNKKLADASVSRIHIERAARRANITIHTARPGIVI